MLTDYQRRNARFDGGKDLLNRKRHVAQIKSGLLKLRNDCDGGADGLVNGLAGLLTPEEIDTLTSAAQIVDRIVATLERDEAEAKRIKATWDKHYGALVAALSMRIITDRAADVVALISRAGDTYKLRDLADDCRNRWGGARAQLRDARREAIASLAYQAAGTDADPSAWAAAIHAELPANAEKHAALVAEIDAIDAAQAANPKGATPC